MLPWIPLKTWSTNHLCSDCYRFFPLLKLKIVVSSEGLGYVWGVEGSGIALFLSVSNVLFSMLAGSLSLPAACMNHSDPLFLLLTGAVSPPKKTMLQWNIHLVWTTSSRSWKQCWQFQFPSYLQGSLYIFPDLVFSFWPQWCCITLWITQQKQNVSMRAEDINLALIKHSKSAISD